MKNNTMLRLLTLLCAISLYLPICACTPTKIEVQDRVVSPDGKFEAVALVTTGAGVGGQVNWFVDVFAAGATPMDPKKLVPSDVDDSIFFASHINSVRIRWQDNSTLLISCDCSSGHLWRHKNNWNGIHVNVNQTGDLLPR